MKKRVKRNIEKDLNLVKQSREALLIKMVDMLDDSSTKLSSCEIRMLLLDAIEIK